MLIEDIIIVNKGLTLIAGRVRIGKTRFCLEIAKEYTYQQGKSVLYISLDKASNEIYLANTEIDIYIDTVSNTIEKIMDKINTLSKEKVVDLVIIDFLEFVSREDKSELLSRDNEIVEIIKKIKELNITLKIDIMVVTNLNRNVDIRENHKPILEDLYYLKNAVEYFDTILFLYNENYYNKRKKDKLEIIKGR